MSKASEAIKAQRKKHRQDHFTDADRALKGQGKKARRAAKAKAYSNQGNENAADFNFDQHGKGHVSGQEIAHLRKSGQSRDQVMAAVQANGGELGKRAQKKLDKWGAAKEKAQTVKENPVATTQPAVQPPVATTQPAVQPPAPQANNNTGTGAGMNNGSNNEVTGDGNAVGNGNVAGKGNNLGDNNINAGGNEVNGDGNATGIGNTAAGNNDVNGDGNATGIGNMTNEQSVDASVDFQQSQDNDQKIENNGNNNYNYQRADNSNRIYGGKTTVFNYQSSGNPDHDSPMSAAVMAGVHAVDDSPAARAARLDQEITMANDYAKDNMDTDWIAQGAIHKARNNLAVNTNALDERIAGREANNFAQAKIDEVKMFGDLDGQTANWKQPTPAKPVETPDFEKMFNTYTDY